MMRNTGEANAQRYVPSLDGIRALSIGLVLLSHFGFDIAPGIFGVTIFFFISGYLITGQILSEIDLTGGLALGKFYLRRVFRLYPALLVSVAIGGLSFVVLGGHIAWIEVVAAVFYLANIYENLHGFESGLAQVSHPFSVLWSLAIEEHYYVVFPLLALCLARRRNGFILAIIGLIIAATVWRYHVALNCIHGCTLYRIEHGTDTRVDSILYGALLATLLRSGLRDATVRLIEGRWPVIVGLGLLFASLVIRNPVFRDTARFSIQGIGLFLAIGGMLHKPQLRLARSLFSRPTLLLIGRWSYSLYLWHWIVLCLAKIVLPQPLLVPLQEHVMLPRPMWVVSVFIPMTAVSLALAAASYYAVEQPMLRVRRAFGSHAMAEAAVMHPDPIDAVAAPGLNPRSANPV